MALNLTRREFLQGALSGAVAFGLAGCLQQTSTVRVLWTNDIHGHLLPLYHREAYAESFLNDNRIERGSINAYVSSSADFADLAKKYGKVGGMAHIAGLIERERAAQPERTLVLDAGDAWYGSAIALLTEGRAPVQVMNAMGYDAMTLHWEFNLGKAPLLARIQEAQFKVLAQNLVDTDFGDRVLPPSIVRDFKDVRVAVVGQAYPFSLLTTELRDANPGWRMGYQEQELQKEIERVRREDGAGVVILLSHMGYEQDRIMAENLSGIDVIVGSHTHDILWEPARVGKTIIVQAGSHGKFVGELDLEIGGGRMTGYRHKLIPILSDRVEPNARVAALIAQWYEPYREKLSRVVGEAQTLLYRRSLYGGPSDAVLARAYREIAGAEVGCASGWRFGSTLLPGTITVEDVYNAMKPTPSPLYKARLSGNQIRLALEDNLDNVFNPDPLQRLGGDATRCAGLQAALNKSAARGQRLVNIRVNETPLDPDRKYLIATSGGRTQYLDAKAEATPRPAVEELLDYIQATSVINAEPIQNFTEHG
ncbi:MAG: 5'-nucleotidase C-terminal domain-containing protein [Chloroflexi bacterium]|nr:5'-nucleotidase C-terminal domain-containing protein [Chloroflexota bacterium]